MSDSKGGGGGRTGRASTAVEVPSSRASYQEFSQEKYGSIEAADYGGRISLSWEAGLSAKEYNEVNNYKQSSLLLNSSLRRGYDLQGPLEGTRQALDAALDRARIPDDIIVYRGVYSDVVDQFFRGRRVVPDKGYMSTSGSTHIAKDFGTVSEYGGGIL